MCGAKPKGNAIRIGVHARVAYEETIAVLQQVIELLEFHECVLYVSHTFLKKAPQIVFNRRVHRLQADSAAQCDAILSLGGDGTLLEALTYVRGREIPIMGINIGRLGFLSNIAKKDIEKAIHHLVEKKYTLDKRALLRLKTPDNLFSPIHFALNEFVVLRRDHSSMICIHCTINGRLLSKFWADGFIVSTATGSTAYALSCGGPILHPHSSSLLATPINSHNLSVRPFVLPDDVCIDLEVETRGDSILASLDSRSRVVAPQIKFSLCKESFSAQLIQLPGHHFFKTLKDKLRWGVDIRN